MEQHKGSARTLSRWMQEDREDGQPSKYRRRDNRETLTSGKQTADIVCKSTTLRLKPGFPGVKTMKTVYKKIIGNGYNAEGWELLWKEGQFYYRSWAGAAVSGERRGNELVAHDSGIYPISYHEALEHCANIPFEQAKDFFKVGDWMRILRDNDLQGNGVPEWKEKFAKEVLAIHGPEKILAL